MFAVDHLVYAAPELDAACRQIEALTGVTPSFGGVHGHGLSHNALIGLGPDCYLEIYAPTPGTTPTSEGADDWIEFCCGLDAPRLMTVCLRPDIDMSALARRAQNGHLTMEGPDRWSRTRPDGMTLEWVLLEPIMPEHDFLVPFFIDWLDSPHPSGDAPQGCALHSLTYQTSQPESLEAVFRTLGLDASAIRKGMTNRVRASLQTPKGLIAL
ncbi:MAG: VOC family protein [Pseudomonadota bacterium]